MAAQALAQQSDNATLSGRVTDSSGKPISKATLLLISGGRSQNGGGPAIQPYRATTGADGAYSFANVEPGAYNLQAFRAGYASAIKGGTDLRQLQGTLRIADGQQIAGMDFALAPAATISGTVTDANGDPVADAQIGLWRKYPQPDGTSAYMRPNQVSGPVTSDALTGNDGKYTIENIAPGTYYLSAGAVIGAPTISLFDIEGLQRNPVLGTENDTPAETNAQRATSPPGFPAPLNPAWHPLSKLPQPATSRSIFNFKKRRCIRSKAS